MSARVSVVCPVYNTAPDYLVAAVNSVFANDSDTVQELILVDDHSTDPQTLVALQQLVASDSRIKLLTSLVNQGPAVARNHGVNAAVSEWIGFIDADDLWAPQAVEKFLHTLDRAPDAEWICGNYSTLDHHGGLMLADPIINRFAGEPLGGDIVRYSGVGFIRHMATHFWFHLGSCFIKKTVIQKIKGFQFEGFFGEDWIFILRIASVSALYYSNSGFYIRRRQHESLSTSPRRLSSMFVASRVAALLDPRLRSCRRELRWNLVRTYQDLAANNLLAGNKILAVRFAISAQLIDPWSYKTTYSFLKCLGIRDQHDLFQKMRKYTTGELIGHKLMLNDIT